MGSTSRAIGSNASIRQPTDGPVSPMTLGAVRPGTLSLLFSAISGYTDRADVACDGYWAALAPPFVLF
jgi:hypothetical protein